MLICHNGAKPVDSVMETPNSPHYTEYYFENRNLSGGILDPGGRPYTQFPYITYYHHLRDFGVVDPNTKFVVKPMPYPWTYSLLSSVGYQYDDLNLHLQRKDKTTIKLNEFFEEEK